ncbi:MAG: hypothetical protein JWM57_1285 [Phycisphaerales bacterium]|nr:hypothetical protein [Phycisphaerales bacterium]
MRTLRIVLAVFTASLSAAGGCTLDPAAGRTLEIRQTQLTSTYRGKFVVDASQLPEGSVERVERKDHWGNPVTELKISSAQAVRILIVPTTQP